MNSNNNKKRLDFIPRPDFVKDLNYLSKLDPSIVDEVKDAISILRDDEELPDEFEDHSLHGYYEGTSEFHLRDTPKGFKATEKNDVVVIYKKRVSSLVVIGIRIGSHAHLFHDEYKLNPRKRS
ncbi:type II toxin-antitoxin system mRNA interferase toxin, RelE/StbE family [Lactobacillus ultunensis]|uniref:type II toxin-antitoxin system mRNA interferase toxin, RelE/StbE family n=1 Tax=Lactobacillus ultunensis TaxID=227945 RepID=UPI0019138D10|nr:type II toxin-antitoxin system mRNA interferase toxin, RelE/StbE family [Lactobacillus ultunensis]QQP29465.1 type II toxin-antitoxin system mRNA interferase toxin, RelE/StbE family [Lactobacillus ultunensis]